MKFGFGTLVVAGAVAQTSFAATVDQWRDRSIYQLLTDRFARTDGSTTAACNTTEGDYCGGSYQGIIGQLDYIQDMGFSAIWISPITAQIPEKTKFGYAWHGYWQQDLYGLNEAFGTADDLKELSKALHDRDMYLMVDIVTNHNGWNGTQNTVDYSRYSPFDDRKYYHSFCDISNYSNQSMVEDCWLGDVTVPLPDLKTEDDTVSEMYNDWIKDLVSNYSIDGLRIDTVKHVDGPFWNTFQSAAGIFATGEVVSSNPTYACDYQQHLDSIINYPAYYPFMSFLNSTSGTTDSLLWATENLRNHCNVSLVTTFTENHDIPRFASQTSDLSLAKNALAITFLWDGIPIVYAGQEQHYNGFADPENREATWLSKYKTTSELYKLTATVNKLRSRALAVDPAYADYNVWAIYNDTNTVALRKGHDDRQIVSVLTNAGNDTYSYILQLKNTGWTQGAEVLEVLSCKKYVVNKDDVLDVAMSGGLPRIFFPTDQLGAKSGICEKQATATKTGGGGGEATPTETKKSAAVVGQNVVAGRKRKAVVVAGVAAAAAAGMI